MSDNRSGGNDRPGTDSHSFQNRGIVSNPYVIFDVHRSDTLNAVKFVTIIITDMYTLTDIAVTSYDNLFLNIDTGLDIDPSPFSNAQCCTWFHPDGVISVEISTTIYFDAFTFAHANKGRGQCPQPILSSQLKLPFNSAVNPGHYKSQASNIPDITQRLDGGEE